jgi:queuine/archaeosine tRNA-ribosyltransferase
MKNIRNSIKLREFDKFEKVFLEQYYSGDIELK